MKTFRQHIKESTIDEQTKEYHLKKSEKHALAVRQAKSSGDAKKANVNRVLQKKHWDQAEKMGAVNEAAKPSISKVGNKWVVLDAKGKEVLSTSDKKEASAKLATFFITKTPPYKGGYDRYAESVNENDSKNTKNTNVGEFLKKRKERIAKSDGARMRDPFNKKYFGKRKEVAEGMDTFKVSYQSKSGKTGSVKIAARDADEAKQKAASKLAGKISAINSVKLDEATNWDSMPVDKLMQTLARFESDPKRAKENLQKIKEMKKSLAKRK